MPALVRHMTVAIYNKSTGGGPDGFVRAMMMARGRLAKWGYIYHGGNPNEPFTKIFLTAKGWKRNLRHDSESFLGDLKDLHYARLYDSIEPRMHELDGPGGKRPPKEAKPKEAKDQQSPEKAELDLDDKPRPLYPPPK